MNGNRIINNSAEEGVQVRKRNSSPELLRLICMLLIVMGHYSTHGNTISNLSVESFSYGTLFIQIFGMGNRTACSVFVILSGYFLFSKEDKEIKFTNMLPLIGEMVLYSLVCWIITPEAFKDTSFLKACFPFLFGNWFVVYYIILYAFSPLLNSMLRSISTKNLTKLVVLVFIFWSIIPTLCGRSISYSSFDFFLVMYILGAYISINHDNMLRIKDSTLLIVGLGSYALIGLSIIILDLLAIAMKNDFILNHARYFMEYNSCISFLAALCIAMFFLRKTFYSRTINFVSKSMLGVYLIHDNSSFGTYIWQGISPNVNYINNPFWHAIVKSIIVFISCIVVDIIRRGTIGWAFEKLLVKIKWRVREKNEKAYNLHTDI